MLALSHNLHFCAGILRATDPWEKLVVRRKNYSTKIDS
jgi:hypothetical protein